jgi:hypothetical protein
VDDPGYKIMYLAKIQGTRREKGHMQAMSINVYGFHLFISAIKDFSIELNSTIVCYDFVLEN